MNARFDGMGRPLSKRVWLRRLMFNRYARLLQLCLYTAVAILAAVVSIVVLVTFEELQHNCPLYASPEAHKVRLGIELNGSQFLQVDKITFGNPRTCYYTLYLNATTAVFATVWGVLITVITSDKYSKKGYMGRTVFPSLLLNSVMFTCELISSCVLTLGFAHWCDKLIEELRRSFKETDKHDAHDDYRYRCPVLQTLPWHSNDEIVKYFSGPRMFALLTFTQVVSWLLTLCAFFLTAICAERFFKSIWHGDLDQSSNFDLNMAPSTASIALQQGSPPPPNLSRAVSTNGYMGEPGLEITSVNNYFNNNINDTEDNINLNHAESNGSPALNMRNTSSVSEMPKLDDSAILHSLKQRPGRPHVTIATAVKRYPKTHQEPNNHKMVRHTSSRSPPFSHSTHRPPSLLYSTQRSLATGSLSDVSPPYPAEEVTMWAKHNHESLAASGTSQQPLLSSWSSNTRNIENSVNNVTKSNTMTSLKKQMSIHKQKSIDTDNKDGMELVSTV